MTGARWTAARAAALLVLCAAPAHGQDEGEDEVPWYREWRTFSIYEENDAFTGSDSAYTQGLRLTWTVQTWRPVVRAALDVSTLGLLPRVEQPCVPQASSDDNPCSSVIVGLGQTIFTPGDLLADTLRPLDRPYAGYLFASVGAHGAYPNAQVSSELMVGVTGPPSLARQSQSLAHWAWVPSAPRPRGWDHQLDFAAHVTLLNQYAWRPPALEVCLNPQGCDGTYDENRVLDVIVPRVEVAVGTLMNRASVGGTVRAGFRYPAAMGLQRIPTTRAAAAQGEKVRRAPLPWGMVFASFDQRFVGTNALLTGSYMDRGEGEWADVRQIEMEHLVNEWSVGAALGCRWASVVGQYVERSREFSTSTRHHFFSLTLSLHQPMVADAP
jgi:lipid A 3-O-deacylase